MRAKRTAASDDIGHKVVDLITHSGEARERLSRQAYTTLEPGNPLGQLQEALELSEKFAPAERRLRQAQREGLIKSDYFGEQIEEAARAEVIGKKEADELRNYHDKVRRLLAVDDFSSDELQRIVTATPGPAETAAAKPARKKAKKTRKKTARKKKASRSGSTLRK